MTTATTRQIATRTATVVATSALVLNGAFHFLSSSYFDAHKTSSYDLDTFAAVTDARMAFGLLTMFVAVAAFAAALAPRIVGHALAVVIGIGALIGAYASISHSMPGVMTAVLIAVGLLLPLLGHFSWRGSRAAWSFMISIICVFGIVTFFGAPKVRNILGIGFWTAMILPCIQFVCVAALAMVRGEYRAR